MFLVSAERKRALVWALVAAVAVASLVVFVVRRRGLKIGAGQIIEQDFKTGAEQILPALAQMIEQRRLVLQQLVGAAVGPFFSTSASSAPSRSAIALCSNHSRCKRHSLPGSIN